MKTDNKCERENGMETRQTLKGQMQYKVHGRWMPLGWTPGMPAPPMRPNHRQHELSEKIAEAEQSDDEIAADHRSEAP